MDDGLGEKHAPTLQFSGESGRRAQNRIKPRRSAMRKIAGKNNVALKSRKESYKRDET
jgi:hypothetical protein